ncbi:uncharacterized protein LOC118320566 isoform X1 [Scophthalmus maximus]|uniref:uncharacterized protein LOC118320566 isoform X1 n=1 Tax=Scophthalmus maximus TaxID=52904 RepID=UPI000F32BE82|nr:uncharacterized protein LOC118320566 isoform X1 [Scophthalmus maximus]
MYLENSEQVKVSGEGESSADAMLAEQCQVTKLTEAADITDLSQGSAELGTCPLLLMEYMEQTVSREMDSSLLCVQHCRMSGNEAEYSTYCNGHAEILEQYSASDRLFVSDQTLDKCETSGLSQPFNECAQPCECFKPWKSSEHSANLSVACNKYCPCCEHCAEHLGLFQQCEPSGQQFDSLDFEQDELAIKCDSVGLCEMSDFTPESTDHIELLQQYEPTGQQCECFDSEPDTSTEDSEQCEISGSTPNITDSVDSLDCDAELCEYDETPNQIECTNSDDDDDDDEESYPCEQNKMEARPLEDVNSSDFNTPHHIFFDDGEHVRFADAPTSDMSTDHCGKCGNNNSEASEEYETTRQTSDKTSDSSEFCTEEDSFSDCSSTETKSFKTCPDGSIPSDPFSDSSGESEKGAQEDSSDEQTQWESFEDDQEMEQNYANGNNDNQKKTPTVDIVVEDYFDLFDRADCYGHAFAPKRHYISCFDGGDVHERLNIEQAATCGAKDAYTFKEADKEIDAQEADISSEEVCEEVADASPTQSHDCESEVKLEDWITDSESSSAEDEVEEKGEVDDLYAENYEEAEEDEDSFDGETCESEGHVSEEEAEVCLSPGNEEVMCAPCADDISVEGDAYEDEVYDAQNYESLDGGASTFDHVIICRKHDEPKPEDEEFIESSEMEPYCSLLHIAANVEMCEPGVEDYYAYQMKSVRLSVKQGLNGLIMERLSCNEIIDVRADGGAPGNKRGDDVLSSNGTEFQAPGVCPAECETVRFGITEDLELSKNLASCSAVEETYDEPTPGSDGDCGLNVISGIRRPQDIIHSVVSEHAKIEGCDAQTEEKDHEQSRDSDEEPSDDESSEPCDCEYCIPPIEQVPAIPLLPRMKSNDAGKICVVIDLDETLVHSSFKPVNNADFIIPVEIDGTVHQVYVLKRPHVDEFLKRMGELFECVLFTASLAKYADPVSDLLDKWGAFRSRLFREACVFHKGNYVKDLSRLGRDLNKVIIIDNSPASYIFHPENAVPVASWFDDMSDTELLDLIPFFEGLSKVDDIHEILQQQTTSS